MKRTINLAERLAQAAWRRLAGRVGETLRQPVEPLGDNGCRWGDREITWPDRVPDLKTWSGQMTLTKIIKKWQLAIDGQPDNGILDLQTLASGASGIDRDACPRIDECGLNLAGLPISQRPGIELLAIWELETASVAVVRSRLIDVLVEDATYRLPVEIRDSNYLFRWGYAWTLG